MLRRLEGILHWMAAIAIAAIAVLVVVDVPLALAGRTTYLGTELAPFIMAIIVFLALPTVTREEGHIRADFFDAFLPERLRAAIKLFVTDLAMLAFAAILLWMAGDLFSNAYNSGERTQGLLRIPVAIPQLAMLVGSGILLLRAIAILIGDLSALRAGHRPRP